MGREGIGIHIETRRVAGYSRISRNYPVSSVIGTFHPMQGRSVTSAWLTITMATQEFSRLPKKHVLLELTLFIEREKEALLMVRG